MKHYHVDWWGFFYILWVVVGFLPYELYWAFKYPNNTLSDQWRAMEQLDSIPGHALWDVAAWGWPHWMLAILLAVFFLWLYIHLVYGILG